MNKYLLLFSVFLSSLTSLSSQITYTYASFPQAGDVLKISMAVDTLMTVTASSATATVWDFSTLLAVNTIEDTIVPASLGSSFAQFPDADVIQPLLGAIGGTAYTDVTSTLVERIGGGIEFGGISFVSPYTNTHITQMVPLTYSDTYSDTYSLNFGTAIDSIPFLRQLIDSAGLPGGISPDSIRISFLGDETRIVDAWGTCIMADSTYDVLRQKTVSNVEIGIEMRVPLFGNFAYWLDVSNFIPLPFPSQTTTVQYDFLAEGVKQPVVRLTLDSAETVITNIEFIDTIVNNPATIRITYIEDRLSVSFFPNPAQHFLNVQINDIMPADGYDLVITDMLARIVFTENSVREDRHLSNISAIPNGLYTALIINKSGEILKREQIKINK